MTRLDRTIADLEDIVTRVQHLADLEQQGKTGAFNARFSRYEELLCLLASCVLGGDGDVDQALRNCREAAARNTPQFENEAAFRGWLVRVLIDEALSLLGTRS